MKQARRVDGVFLRAADPQVLADWYERTLGVPARRRADGVELHGPPGQSWDVSVEVAELDAVVAALREGGAEVQDDGAGVLVRDPAGHVVRLHRPDDAQYVRPVEGDDEPRRVRTRVLALALAAMVAVVLVIVVTQQERDEPPSEQAAPELSSAPSMKRPEQKVSTQRRTLPIDGDWDLYVYQSGQLVHADLAAGTVSRTRMAAYDRELPLSLVTGPEGIVIQASGMATGYLVRDGEPPVELPPVMARADLVLPGPKPGQLWLPTNRGDGLRLSPMRFDGTGTGRPVQLPPLFYAGFADGRGGVVVTGVGGEYRVDRDGLRRVSTGRMLAIGPTGFLAEECDDGARCSTVVIDRDGSRRTVRTRLDRSAVGRPGPISPDGRTAAVISNGDNGDELLLLDLDSGRVTGLAGEVTQSLGQARPVWSPDGKWLIMVANDDVLAVDPRSGKFRSLGLGLASADAVAIRP